MMDASDSSFHLQLEPSSFSFDNPRLYNPPQRTISNCLRLKTNQSREERPLGAAYPRKESRKEQQTEQSEAEAASHSLKLVQGEYDLRTESLIKQYELRLNKQQQYFGLREWKLKQQLQNLTKQNSVLTEQLRRTRTTAKQTQSQCSLCSDGQVLAHYSKVLAENEQNHKGCLSEKKELNKKVQGLSAKLQALESEHETVSSQFRGLNRQLRSSQSRTRQVEGERDQALEQLAHIDFTYKEKIHRLEGQSKHYQRELGNRELRDQELRDKELSQNKASLVSHHQFNNPRASMNSSSLLRPRDRDREEKENQFGRGRASLNKITSVSDEDHDSRVVAKKMSENLPRNNNRSFKYEPMKWKYF